MFLYIRGLLRIRRGVGLFDVVLKYIFDISGKGYKERIFSREKIL